MKEIWKDIPGYEGLYQVSNWGQVKSLKKGKGHLMKPPSNKDGYLNVNLYIGKHLKNYKVHQLVAMAFLGHIPDGLNTVVNHIDNNPQNNHLDNLELTTQGTNSRIHKIDVGVSWSKLRNKWTAHIRIGKKNYLGLFTNKQDALDMYQKALANIHLYNGDAKAFRLALTTVTL